MSRVQVPSLAQTAPAASKTAVLSICALWFVKVQNKKTAVQLWRGKRPFSLQFLQVIQDGRARHNATRPRQRRQASPRKFARINQAAYLFGAQAEEFPGFRRAILLLWDNGLFRHNGHCNAMTAVVKRLVAKTAVVFQGGTWKTFWSIHPCP